MSTVIKGLSMPKNCLLCPCCVGEGIGMGRQHYCQAIDDEPCVSETYRPKNCPLIEIPTPHDRLIDADEIKEKLLKYVFKAPDMTATEFVEDELSTIVEAEE